MMNIKDFLMDNYIYIIIVIVLIIVTIVGFLADKKKNSEDVETKEKRMKGKNKETNNNGGEQAVMTQPISYQPVNNQMQGSMLNTIPQNLNQMPNLSVIPNNNSPLTNQPAQAPTNSITASPLGMNSQPSPVNNGMSINQMTTSFNNNSSNMESQPNNNQMNNMSIPEPVEPINQNINVNPEPMYQPLSEQKPSLVPTPQAIPNISVNSAPESQPQMMNYNQGMNNVNNNMVSPMNMAPNANGPVMPTPIPNPTENTVPQPITPPSPVVPQPVNFVYGPGAQGQNNNPNMQ